MRATHINPRTAATRSPATTPWSRSDALLVFGMAVVWLLASAADALTGGNSRIFSHIAAICGLFTVGGALALVLRLRRTEPEVPHVPRELATLLDRSTLAVLLHDGNRVSYASPVAVRQLGTNILTDPLIQFVHPDDRATFSQRVTDLRAGRPLETAALRFVGTGQVELGVNLDTLPLVLDGYRWFVQVLGGLAPPAALEVDASPQRAPESGTMDQQIQELQRLEGIGRLAGGVAHDFNNLLTVIIGLTKLSLEDLDESSPMAQDLTEVLEAAYRAEGLTRQLLSFSRRQRVEARTVDVNELILQLDKMMRRILGEDIELVVLLQPKISSVHVDPNQLDQVLVNLAANARDAMFDGGKLTISTGEVNEKGARWVTLTVADTGAGMSEYVQKKIFEPFFTTKRTGHGTGLGLATSYGIIKQAGGELEVHSAPGRGSTFRILLPAVTLPPERVTDEHDTVETPTAHGETILLVEDEPGVRAVARGALERLGYRVITAENGSVALERAHTASEDIDLLLTDVVMPQMGGAELAVRLTAERPALRVLFMSGYNDDRLVHHQLTTARAGFLQKPFHPHSLAHKVREMLGKRSGTMQ